jgi:hypothetical protein
MGQQRRLPSPVRCWGVNTYGKLGDWSYTFRLTPVLVRMWEAEF